MAMPALALAGLDAVYCLETAAEVDELRTVVGERLAAPVPRTAIQGMARELPANPARIVVLHCLRMGFRHNTAESIAWHFRRDRRTLARWLRESHMPALRVWLKRGRSEHALALRAHGYTFTDVAHRMGYESAAGVAMLLRKRDRP